ncbi:hypothetical protein K1719_017985 [Acacia pycnantha]|nr:hypothetical protein K1719_017985 [Acacia pycnantha]
MKTKARPRPSYLIWKARHRASTTPSSPLHQTQVPQAGKCKVVSAVKGRVRETGEQTNFPGHLVMNKSKLHKRIEEMRNAVSTSHCTQPNTMEFGMTFGWRKLQHLSDRWWDVLY